MLCLAKHVGWRLSFHEQWRPAPGMDLVMIKSLALALWLKEVSPESGRKPQECCPWPGLFAYGHVPRAVSANLRLIIEALWGRPSTLRGCLGCGDTVNFKQYCPWPSLGSCHHGGQHCKAQVLAAAWAS